MTIKLYIDYSSQPSRAVLALCLLNNIPVEIIETTMMSGTVTPHLDIDALPIIQKDQPHEKSADDL
jgi:hypothetical protein